MQYENEHHKSISSVFILNTGNYNGMREELSQVD